MLSQLFFSIIIPLYNKEDFIENTLKSVLKQNYAHFEVIVVNDGSTDKSVEIVERFQDQRITIINQENKGLSAARNSGIKASRYDYIAFLDADDLWCEDYLTSIYNLIKFNSTSKVYATTSKVLRRFEKPDLTPQKFTINNIQVIADYFNLKKNIFSFSSIVIKKSVFKEVGFFNEKINFGEEEDFFIRCFSKNNLTHYKVPKVYYLKGFHNQLTTPNSNFKRIIPDYSVFLNKNNSHTLKPYIDFIYFKLVVLYKMEQNHELVELYKNKIDVVNLSVIQKIKYYLPTPIFYHLKSIYIWFSKRFIQS